jgi:hypothetical protein
MANLIDILINATWGGGGALKSASGDLRAMGNNAASTSVELAAVQQRSGLLNKKLAELGTDVAEGTLTVAEATTQYQAYAGTLTEVSVAAPKASLNLAGLATKVFAVTAALGAATIAGKKFFDVLRQGAELEAVQIRFDRLAESIDTTGDALRGDLRIAMQGLVSDTEAMATATDFLALGLVDSHDGAVRLASVAAQLGFDMNQLVLTMTNLTTMRFDALGVRVVGFKEKVNELEAAGLDAGEAFREAFLQQAEEQIELVGSRADTTAGQLDTLTSQWKDFGDEVKRSVLEGTAPLIESLTQVQRAILAAETAAQDMGEAVDGIVDESTIADFVEAANEFGQFSLFTLPTSGEDIERMESALTNMVASMVRGEPDIVEQVRLLEELGFEIDEEVIKLGGIETSFDAVYDAMTRIISLDAAQDIAELNRLFTELDEAVDPLVGDLDKMVAEFEKGEVSGAAFLERMDTSIETFAGVAENLGGVSEAVQFYEAVLRDAGQATDDFGLSAEELNDKLEEQEALLQERAELFLDFQQELTDIAIQEGERREEAEATYEQRRTDLVHEFGQRRAQEEEDWERRRLRAQQRLQGQIEGVQEDSADRQEDLRERANLRLADLERDHLDRMQDIINDADAQLTEAAGRLDAAAVARIQRQRDDALEDEEQSFARSRDEIQRQLDRQIEAEREAAAERVADLERFHEERRLIEEEDRAIRLERQQDAHDERMAQLEGQEAERLALIESQAEAERQARNDQYEDFWADREGIEESKMADILAAESAWWDERRGLVPETGGHPGVGLPPSSADVPSGGPDLPSQFFGGASTNVGGININISGAEDPETVGDVVRRQLLELFGQSQ